MLEGLSIPHIFWLLVGIAVWFVPIVLIAQVVTRVRGAVQPDPQATLADRLHRGEITREQFDTAMAALDGPRTYTRWPGHTDDTAPPS